MVSMWTSVVVGDVKALDGDGEFEPEAIALAAVFDGELALIFEQQCTAAVSDVPGYLRADSKCSTTVAPGHGLTVLAVIGVLREGEALQGDLEARL
jgi:hypothetical protein